MFNCRPFADCCTANPSRGRSLAIGIAFALLIGASPMVFGLVVALDSRRRNKIKEEQPKPGPET
jgi:hypothetical protein